MPRLYCPAPLHTDDVVDLPATAARHAQVLRLQPGMPITLFNGGGGEFEARVTSMGRQSVHATVGIHHAIEREAVAAVHLAIGMPANERMDWLVEKATELGATSIQPLLSARSVLRLDADRALKRRRHWEGIVSAACEQCGRNRLTHIHPVLRLEEWLLQPNPGLKLLLSPRADSRPLAPSRPSSATAFWVLSGPEGGLTDAEEDAALAHGFIATGLGPRILRAETAPLAALAVLALSS